MNEETFNIPSGSDESRRKRCVNCGGESDTTVKGKPSCNECKAVVYSRSLR